MKYPYTVTPGALKDLIQRLRLSFPTQLTVETLQKLGIASNNESYIINTLRALQIIDDDGKKLPPASAVFVQRDEREFAAQFGGLVKSLYGELFELWGDDAWELDADKLIQFFRTTDLTSDIVGKRQAKTFGVLAELAGHLPKTDATRAAAVPRKNNGASTRRAAPAARKVVTSTPAAPAEAAHAAPAHGPREKHGPAITLRVEINLPVTDDQKVYDQIFRSFRENLLTDVTGGAA